MLAGDVVAVAAALCRVIERGAELGLALNLLKCELVTVGDLPEHALLPHFPCELLRNPDGTSRVQQSFELLGAPVGDDAYVASHTAARVQAARPLLQALGALEDPQVGLRLLRSCAGHCKLTHSVRCCPLFGGAADLQEFDALVQECFSSLTGLHLTALQWEQATRGLPHAGLGLRSVVRDAPAAYLASVGGCVQACRELDPDYAPSGLASEPVVLLAATCFSASLEQPLAAHLALSMTQKALTARSDAASWTRHLSTSSITARALLRSEAEQGARAWLAAVPAAKTRMEGAAFVMELQRRLGVPDAPADAWCPKCDGIMDRFSLHAGTCAAGGERTQRHNALRDLLASWAARAGLQPEVEKPGLLLPQRPDEARLSQRRPADIFLPSLSGGPAALDLAITAPQRQESLAQAGQEALAAATQYAAVKRSHLDTARTCAAQGVRFMPLLAESTGGWEPAASKTLQLISRAVAARTGSDAGLLHADLLQELSVLLRAHHARAALHRRAEASAQAGAP